MYFSKKKKEAEKRELKVSSLFSLAQVQSDCVIRHRARERYIRGYETLEAVSFCFL
jgi:hypothetical protein